MLKSTYFTFNPFQENTYVISDDQSRCWFVDPGMHSSDEIKIITDYVTANGLQPQAIINTHTHIDHILGIQPLKDIYHIPFGMHQADLPVLQHGMASAMMFGIDFKESPTPDFFISESAPLRIGDEALEVRSVPGHSPGSIAFYYAGGNWVIAGDVLFEGSIGRTDLPGGNLQMLLQSIRTGLFTLPGKTTVYPGHGNTTTVDEEKNFNQFLR